MEPLFRDAERRVELRAGREGEVEFRSHAEAVHYLRRISWRTGVIDVLRRLLTEHRNIQLWRLEEEKVIHVMASLLFNRHLQLVELMESRATMRTQVPASRHGVTRTAQIYRDFDKRVEIRSARDGIIRYHRDVDAVVFLREHRDLPGLAAALRQALGQHHDLDLRRLSDEEVFAETERRLRNGWLQLMEIFEPRIEAPATVEEEPEEETPAEVAAPPAPPPLLPLLEELQIEGAEVLPEITQTLEQIDVTIAGIGSATVSLAPAPSKIPAINATMQSSSASITDTLGAL